MENKKTTLKKIQQQILPCFKTIILKKLTIQERLKLGRVIKKLEIDEEILADVKRNKAKEYAILDNKGELKLIPHETIPGVMVYDFESAEKKADYFSIIEQIMNEKIDLPAYQISIQTLEEAFKTNDEKIQRENDQQLGFILPMILDFITE